MIKFQKFNRKLLKISKRSLRKKVIKDKKLEKSRFYEKYEFYENKFKDIKNLIKNRKKINQIREYKLIKTTEKVLVFYFKTNIKIIKNKIKQVLRNRGI